MLYIFCTALAKFSCWTSNRQTVNDRESGWSCAGLINIIYAGIIANVVRFIYIAYLESPWWILPFECIQGQSSIVN